VGSILGQLPAGAETIKCTAITTLPAIITVQGIYCFTGDLATSMRTGNAIEIQTNNVVIDLNGHKLGGLAAGAGTGTFGIHASNRQNITIRNGTIRGFRQAIVLENLGLSQGHLVEDIRADQNTEVGIQVAGSGSIVRNNQIVATGGTTFFGPDAQTYGIYIGGQGARVINNDVINTHGVGAGYGTGIYEADNVGLAVINNRISDTEVGIDLHPASKYRDNLTIGVGTPYVGGTDAGNNQ
jgi:hypothetical protein